MNVTQLKNLIEAALLAYGQPLSMDQLRGLFDEVDRPDAATVREALEALARECVDRPVELVEVASGWRLQDRKSTRLNSSHIQKSRMPSSA